MDQHLEQLRIERPVAGGAGLGHAPDGRVVLVTGALPGEVVDAEVTGVHPRRVMARTITVLAPSPARVAAPCPHVADGCGGCDWQHVDPTASPQLRLDILRDAARHVGRVELPPTVAAPARELTGGRTTVRLARRDRRIGFRRGGSNEVVAVDSCLVAHPLVDDLIADLDPGRAEELTIRVGATTGERLVLAEPTAEGVVAPADVAVVGADELRAGRRVWIHDEVAGRRWRISARSFFQAGPGVAEDLVAAVTRAADGAGDRLVDLYAGVGLFAGTVGADRRTVAVERSGDSVADARINLPDARVVRIDVRKFRATPADLVIADPARAGLGREAADVVAATGAARVVLVSCDAAAFARDLSLLIERGYRPVGAELVDAFPGTSHVEVVTRLER